jgi:hypothetical protein
VPTHLSWNDTSTAWVTWSSNTISTTSSSVATWQTWSTSTSTNAVWTIWVRDHRGREWPIRPGQRICLENVWYEWTTSDVATTYATPVREPTAEELDQERERRIAAEARATEERKLRLAAEARAEELLQAHLDEEQRKELAEHDRFQVLAPSGRRYAIHRGVAGNVRCDARRYCAHAQDGLRLPAADHMLMQKLMLETDENAFLAVANVS